MREPALPRLVIAGVASGVGKTTLTAALARALTQRGLRVATFKCGPDYLDPSYHRRAAGGPCHNLDGWMMGEAAVRATFAAESRGADVALIEGVMGLFDGASTCSGEGSTAEIAAWLAAPVLLVIDAGGMARSVAALAQGFARFDPAVQVAGVLANRLGSAHHLALLREACVSPPVLGGLLRDALPSFPSRHLGLHAAEGERIDAELDAAAAALLAHTPIDDVLALARSAPPLPAVALPAQSALARCRIGIAQDAAFSFYYPYNLALLVQLGAELVPFSPLADQALPAVDGVYLGGGYPELHAERLARNVAMREALRAHVARGRPLYAECGGLMYASDAIVTGDGVRHPMLGLIGGEAVMQPRLAALGYVEVETVAPSILGPAGVRFRGHQFRYSQLTAVNASTCYRVRSRRAGAAGDEGYAVGSVLASYVHAHWASNPEPARGFVRACAR